MIIKGSGKAAVILWKSPVLFVFEEEVKREENQAPQN